MDASWNNTSNDGWFAPGSPQFVAAEIAFGVDVDGNGTIGA